VETLSLFFVTLTRKIKSQEILKLNGLNNINIKVESYGAQTDITQCYNCQNFGHVVANCTHFPLPNVYGAVVATCIENALKRRIQSLHRAVAISP
jgi:hypothetical protein